MMKKTFFWVLLQAFVVSMLCMWMRAYDFRISSFGGFALCLAYTWFARWRYGQKASRAVLFWAILIGFFHLEIPFRMISWGSTLVSLPDFLMRLLGFVLGWFAWGRRKSVVAAMVAAGLVINVFLSVPLVPGYSGWEMWLLKRNTGHFLPYVDCMELPAGAWEGLEDANGRRLAQAREGRITLIDFWYKGCGICWKNFPNFQKLYDYFKDNPSVYVCSVFLATGKEDDAAMADSLLRAKGYDFPAYLIHRGHLMLDTLNINSYPRLVLLDAQGRVTLNLAGGNHQLLERELNRLLQEQAASSVQSSRLDK